MSFHDKPLVGETAGQVWRELLLRIFNDGTEENPRNLATRELLTVKLRLNDMRANIIVCPERNLNYRFMIAEWLWIWLGSDDLALISKYNSRLTEFSDDGRTLTGAYGPRLRPQLGHLLTTLWNDPSSRQAVATIWRPNPGPSRDIPCTIDFHFFIRNQKLHLIVHMRSSDIWLGLPYDIFSFTMWANCLAPLLRVELGSLTMYLDSSHLYMTNKADALRVLSSGFHEDTLVSPQLTELPKDRWLKEALAGRQVERMGNAWDQYAFALMSKTSKEALRILENLQWLAKL